MSVDYFGQDNTAGIDQGGYADRGSLILNPQYNASYFAPLYDGSVSTIRILPFFDPTTPNRDEVPYRGGPGFARFSPWFMSYPAFRSIGQNNKVSMVINDPYKNPQFDQNSNPLCVLSSEIRKAVAHAKKNHGNLPNAKRLPNGSTQIPHYWYGLVEGEAGRSADLPALNSVVYVQCLLYQHKGKKGSIFDLPYGLRPEDGPVVFEMTGGLWTNKVSKLLAATNPGYQGNPADFEAAYAHGDPVSLKSGRFLHIFKIGSDPRNQGQAPGAGGNMYGNQANAAGSSEKKEIGYDCFFTKTLPGYPQDNGATTAMLDFPAGHEAAWVTQKIKTNAVPFNDLIRVPTPIQQASLVSSLFPPEVLMYAWESHPEWISDDLRQRAAAVIQPAAAMLGGAPPVWTPPVGNPVAGGWTPPAVPYGAAPGQAVPASFPGLTMPPAPSGAPAWAPPTTMPAGISTVHASAQTAVGSFSHGAVPQPPAVAPGHFFTNPAAATVPAAALPQADSVAASLPSAAAEFTQPAPQLNPAPSVAPPSAPTPPGMPLPQPQGITSNIDHLRSLAGQPAAQ